MSLLVDDLNGLAISKYEQQTVVTESNVGLTKSVLDGVVRQLSARPPNQARRVTVGGLPGFEYELVPKGMPGVRSRSIFLFHGRDEYQLNCQFTAARRAEVMRACDQALESLRVTGSPSPV